MPNTVTMTASVHPLRGYPMRPAATMLTLTPANVIGIVTKLEADGWLVQPKLNGDRVLLAKRDGYIETR
ncbi:MAG: hypothetical protein FJ395_16575, partial [Verrucomicrobia bacterium]|nr:hypothetical protein [Verrucomicrobiota bacterium]